MRLYRHAFVVTIGAIGAIGALGAACGFGDNVGHQHTQPACGDGSKDPGEGCDDGNRAAGDGCSDACSVETANPVCGNGVKEAAEACDDGNATAGDGCTAGCELEPGCGNGQVDSGETCDDGNIASGDGCSPTCQTEESGACSLFPQSGCGGGTPACDLRAIEDGSTECRAVTASGTSDSRCNAATACAAGYSCVGEVGVTSSCMKFCAVDGDCSGTGSRCAFGLVNDDGMSLNIKVCSNACALMAQTGCPSGMGCLGFESSGGDYTDCRVMGTKFDGQTCQSSLDCMGGSVCVNATGTPRCYGYCRIGEDDCALLDTCNGFANPLVIGTTTYGFCN